MKPFQIPVPQGGYRPDLDPMAAGFRAYSAAQNFYLKDGFFQVRPGVAAYADDINQRAMAYAQYIHSDGTLRTVLGTSLGWWCFDAGTRTWIDISGTALTGSASNMLVFRVFQKAGAAYLLGVNGKDAFNKWDGNTAANYSAVGGTPPIARTMMVIFNYVILGNLLSGGTISPVAVDVSAEGDFDNGWGATLTKLLNDTPGPIQMMMEFGNFTGAIYKTDAIVNVYPQGSTEPFRFEFSKQQPAMTAQTFGPCGSQAGCGISEGVHALLCLDYAIRINDGVSLTKFPYAIQKHIKDTANPAIMERSFMFYNPEAEHIWAFYPETGVADCNLAVCVEKNTGNFYPFRFDTLRFGAAARLFDETGLTVGEIVGTVGQQTQTLGSYGEKAPRNFFGEIGGQSYIDLATDDAGAAIPFYAETGLVGGDDRKSTVGKVFHKFKKAAASQNVTVKLGLMNDGEDRVLSDAKTVDIGNAGPYKTGHRKSARYFSMRLEGNATKSVIWRGSNAQMAPRGRR